MIFYLSFSAVVWIFDGSISVSSVPLGYFGKFLSQPVVCQRVRCQPISLSREKVSVKQPRDPYLFKSPTLIVTSIVLPFASWHILVSLAVYN